MQINFLRNLTKDPQTTREVLTDRIARVLQRFGDRIREVSIRVHEKVIGEHGTPRAHCSIDCALANGGTIRINASHTQLIPVISKVCDSLADRVSRDPRLGSRKPRGA